MATQSLYRRYRPRRFGELRGQDHIVRALRNSVVNGREGQAYLFSGPRGTGKTTTARILAKVLNCTAPAEGEPCCECDSCRAVEAGTSYDVIELDAASYNGVDDMRELIERSSLATPGRHRVYILDEVHMLSKAAEAALLKTLEEPPEHVVFVLATTDPQKVSDTIRSRTQHLQFHLLPLDELEAYVRWVIEDAGLKISEDAIAQVLQQGAGSARDTLSALELSAAAGGEAEESVSLEEIVAALVEHNSGRALTAVAHAMHQGRDARTLTEELVRHLRDMFLSLQAPELVQLPERMLQRVSEQARLLGAVSVVRAMTVLGESMVEMRHAPDPRLLLEVSMVKLTTPELGDDLNSLRARLDRVEQAVARGRDASAPLPRPAPIDPNTGRAQLGGKARSSKPTEQKSESVGGVSDVGVAVSSEVPTGRESKPDLSADTKPVTRTASGAIRAEPAVREKWMTDILPGLKGSARAIVAGGEVVVVTDTELTVEFPNAGHCTRATKCLADVQHLVDAVLGVGLTIKFVAAEAKSGKKPEEIHDIDPAELTDAPKVAGKSAEDHLSDFFPGITKLEDPKK